LQTQVLQLEAELESAKEQQQTLTGQVRDKDEKIRELQTKREKMELSIAELEATNKNQNNQILSLSTQFQNTSVQVEMERSKKAELEANIKAKQEEISALKDQVGSKQAKKNIKREEDERLITGKQWKTMITLDWNQDVTHRGAWPRPKAGSNSTRWKGPRNRAGLPLCAYASHNQAL